MTNFFQFFLKRNILLAASPMVVLTMVLEVMPAVIPYTVQTSSLVMPVSEWTLSRAQNGDLITTLKDNRTGKLSAFSTSVFQRGNQANFQLNPNIYRRPYLNKGDTVASLFSNQDHEQLVQLQGQLAVQKAELQLDNVGQKPADVESRFNEMALAKQELATQRLLTNRTIALYQDSLTSQQEYEMAVNKLRVRELNVQTMAANYRSAATGVRSEQLQVIRTRIRLLQQQIEQIQRTLKDLTLTSPVSGTILLKKAPVDPTEEVLVAVADNSSYVMLLPLKYRERDYVQLGQKIEVEITGTTQKASGEIIGIDNAVQLVDGRPAFFVTALITEKNLPLVPGMVIRTTIWCQSISLKDHLARMAHSLFVY
jgi:hypothetical protein